MTTATPEPAETPEPASMRALLVELLNSAAHAVEQSPEHMWSGVPEGASDGRRTMATAPWLLAGLVRSVSSLAWAIDAADPDDPQAAPERAVLWANLGIHLIRNSSRVRHVLDECAVDPAPGQGCAHDDPASPSTYAHPGT